jgi:short-subunit dehydrogenase
MAMKREIDGMVVVITGASAGIGKALAVALSALGAKLVLSARRIELLHQLNQALGGRHRVIQADVSRREDCERLVAESKEHFGRIDTLVCNAGYGLIRSVEEMTPEEIQAIFQTNVFGTTDCIRAAVPIMREQEKQGKYRGQIMIVSSAAARRGLPYYGAYSATKAAQLSLAEALRVELKADRIAVTSVHPIGTDTDFFSTSERTSGMKMPPRSTGEHRQSVEVVAKKMVAAIERPRPEVWPFGPSRIGLSLATLFPRTVDKVMGKARGQIGKLNQRSNG